jgi:hypothetical protein
MSSGQLMSLLAGLAIGGFGCVSILQFFRRNHRPLRWGKRGKGPPISRRSIILTGASSLVLGATIFASAFGFSWVDRAVLPVVFWLTFIAFFGAAFADMFAQIRLQKRSKALHYVEVRMLRRIAYGFAFAVVIYLLLLIYANRRPADSVESRRADTNDVSPTNK